MSVNSCSRTHSTADITSMWSNSASIRRRKGSEGQNQKRIKQECQRPNKMVSSHPARCTIVPKACDLDVEKLASGAGAIAPRACDVGSARLLHALLMLMELCSPCTGAIAPSADGTGNL